MRHEIFSALLTSQGVRVHCFRPPRSKTYSRGLWCSRGLFVYQGSPSIALERRLQNSTRRKDAECLKINNGCIIFGPALTHGIPNVDNSILDYLSVIRYNMVPCFLHVRPWLRTSANTTQSVNVLCKSASWTGLITTLRSFGWPDFFLHLASEKLPTSLMQTCSRLLTVLLLIALSRGQYDQAKYINMRRFLDCRKSTHRLWTAPCYWGKIDFIMSCCFQRPAALWQPQSWFACGRTSGLPQGLQQTAWPVHTVFKGQDPVIPLNQLKAPTHTSSPSLPTISQIRSTLSG